MNNFQPLETVHPYLKTNFFCDTPWKDSWSHLFLDFSFQSFLYKKDFLVCFLEDPAGKKNGLPFTDTGGVFSLSGKSLDLELFHQDVKKMFQKDFTFLVNSIFCPVQNEISEYFSGLIDYRVNLSRFSSETELQKSFRKTLRHILQKSPNFRIETKKPKSFDPIYKLYLQTVREKMNIALPKVLFETLCHDERCEIFTAYYKNRLIAFSVFINEPSFSHYYLSGIQRNFRKEPVAHHLLYQKIVRDWKQKKDFITLGGTRESGGLNTFKRGWGGEIAPMYRITDQPTTDTVRESKIRRLWKYIPLFVLPKISSQVFRKLF